MLKKYYKKLICTIKFSCIVVNNIKANTGNLSFNINDVIYTASDKKVDNNINDISKFIQSLKILNCEFKNGEKSFNTKDLDDYFIESITGVNNNDVKLDKISVTLKEDVDIVIKLVKKEDIIDIVYSNGCDRRLKNIIKKNLLKKIVQGENIKGIGEIANNYEFIDIEKSKDKGFIFCKNFNLHKGKKLILEIGSIYTDNDTQTFICNFASGVEDMLLSNLNLDNIYDYDREKIRKLRTGTELMNEINKISVIDDGNYGCFFTGNLEVFHFDIKIDITDSTTEQLNDKWATIFNIKNIKEENINPLYLKKKFSLNFDYTDDAKKIVKEIVKNSIADNLKKNLEDQAIVTYNKIKAVIESVKDTFINNSLNNADNLKVTVGENNYTGDTTIPSKNITITIKNSSFNDNSVDIIIKVTFNTDAVKNTQGKGLNDDLNNRLTADITKEITKADFFQEIKNRLGNYLKADESLDDNDFDFGNTINGDIINNDGVIKFTDNIVHKLNDNAFKTEREEKKEEDENKQSEGTSDGNETNTKKGCCGRCTNISGSLKSKKQD